jgi:HEAT repeat protein
MEEKTPPHKISFDQVIAALLDFDTPFPPRLLYRLSDLMGPDLSQFEAVWPSLPDWRRQALLEDLEQMFENDTLLSFEAICRLALRDDHPQVRIVALRSLQEYEVADLVPSFLKILSSDKDHEMRALAAGILGQYVYLGEIEDLHKDILETIEIGLLQAAENGKTPLIRQRATESLGFSSRREVPELIEIAFNTQEEEWMSSALTAMGRTYDQRWHPTVLKMLDHPAPRVRYEAIRAAGELEISAAKQSLLAFLQGEEREIFLAAVWALSQIGGEDLQKVFEELLAAAESDEEADLIEEALDNLVFNESISLHDSLDFDEDYQDDFDDDFDY